MCHLTASALRVSRVILGANVVVRKRQMPRCKEREGLQEEEVKCRTCTQETEFLSHVKPELNADLFSSTSRTNVWFALM